MNAGLSLVGFLLGCLVLTVSLNGIYNQALLSKPKQFELYCAVYPYSYNNMTSLNETDFQIQIQRVKEIGFDGVLLWNVECFYDEGKLGWVMDLCKNQNLTVIIAFDYFNRTYNFPFPKETWNKTGFFNDAELNLFCDYLTNVSTIVRGYINFKGYIVYFPYDSVNAYQFWFDRCATIDYKWRYERLCSAIRKADGHPIWAGVMLWNAYPIDIYNRLPKDLVYARGFAFQPYNTVDDDIQKDKIKELYDYFKAYDPQIGEFGYRLVGPFEHGRASSEQRKAEMIKEFLDYVKLLNHKGFVCYFGLTDFPPEDADYGIIYEDYSLKPSGTAFKEWIKQNEK
jgi:hypothetical protein